MQTSVTKYLKKIALTSSIVMAFNVHAATVSLNPDETTNYVFSWTSGLGFATNSFEVIASKPSWLPVFVNDIKEGGDEFALWIDGAKQAWSEQGYSDKNFTANIFAALGTGKHTISIEITKLAPGYTKGDANVTFGNLIAQPVPEPETYAMFAAGLAVLGAIARRRKQK